MKRAIIVPALVTAFVALSPVGVALADNPHDGNPSATGQPNKEADTSQPGVTSPRGFSTGGFANAEEHYANKEGTHAVSQYDVAGFQFCSHRGTC